MVFVMKYFNYIFSILTVTILLILITITNTPSQLYSQNVVFASSTQQQADSSSENSDDFNEENEESETTQENINSAQTESDTGENSNDNGNDLSSTDQNNRCPNTSAFSNVRTYIGQDGCQYPCLSSNSIDQDNIPVNCLIESSSQSSAGFSVNEENPVQPEQQTNKPSQQNAKTTPSQNAFVSPRIDSDTSTGVSNSEVTTTQKSLNPAGKLRSGPGQTESSIPSLSYDPSKPYSPGAGNTGVEGTPLVPPSQTESSIPSLSYDPSKPYSPGAGNTALKGPAFLTVYSNFTNPEIPIIAELCVYTSNPSPGQTESSIPSLSYDPSKPYEMKANPYCIEGSFDGTLHTVQAPGLVGIKVLSTNFDLVQTSDCNFDIYPKESKSCLVQFTNFLKPK
jgi:hypothetical protein